MNKWIIANKLAVLPEEEEEEQQQQQQNCK